MSVYICFGRWKNFKSRLIQWITKSKWSHVWLEYTSDLWGTRMVVHADSKGVVIEPVSNFWERRGKAHQVACYKVNKGNIEEGFKKSAKYLGKDYGYLALIWNAFMLILLKIGFKEKTLTIARDLNRYICSEFVILFLKNSSAWGVERLDAEATWPGKLCDFLINEQRGNLFTEPPYIRSLYED